MKIITIYNLYHKNEKKVFHVLLYSIILLGISLAIYQFFYNRSLWNDEAALALNIIDKSFSQLLQPLDYKQVAPIAYLFVEKFLTLLMGKSEYALRIFSLVAFILSIPMMYLVSNRLTNNKTLSLFASALFSVNFTFIRFSNEVKQYSLDVLFTLIIIYLTLSLSFQKSRSLLLYGLVGAVAVWFSNPSIVILAISGLYILTTEVYKKQNYKIFYPFLLWGLSFGLYYTLFIYHHPSAEFMREYWKNAFFPLGASQQAEMHFLYLHFEDIFKFVTRTPMYHALFWMLYLFGILYAFIKKNYKLLYFVFAPLLLHLFLSGLKLYPFDGRLILYLLALLTLFYAFALYSLYESLLKRIKIPLLILLVPLVIIDIEFQKHIPFDIEDQRGALAKIKQSIEPQEELYIYNMAYVSYRYYNDSGIVPIKHRVVAGSLHRGRNEQYDEELLSLKGKVWLYFAHVYRDEERYMISFLIKRGAKVIHKYSYLGCGVYHIDSTSMDRERKDPYYVDGFYGWEGGKLGRHGWSSGDAKFILPNRYNRPQKYRISFELTTVKKRFITIAINSKEIIHRQLTVGQKSLIDEVVQLHAGENSMSITTDVPADKIGRDPRDLSFAIENLKYSAVKK